jgi:hypothetical protein
VVLRPDDHDLELIAARSPARSPRETAAASPGPANRATSSVAGAS